MPDLGEILASALSLGVDDRATLAERLLASLDQLDEGEAERLWVREAERRLKEYQAGRAEATSARDVAKKAADLFR